MQSLPGYSEWLLWLYLRPGRHPVGSECSERLWGDVLALLIAQEEAWAWKISGRGAKKAWVSLHKKVGLNGRVVRQLAVWEEAMVD